MLRPMRLLGILVVAGVAASGASATEETIYPGVGIGKVKLGMSRAQVLRALGRDYVVNESGSTNTELAWNFSSWTVRLRDGRAVEVGTTLHGQRTTKRVGPGTFWLKLVKAYPGGACTMTDIPPVGSAAYGVLEYLVAHKGGTQTLFTLHAWPPRAYYGAAAKTFFVVSVAVRRRYEALPEFARDYPGRCRDGWQSTPLPR
ncbi:MAG TPA: hypothetical protein VF232_03120 [Gaiellaceae bacterium]